MTKYICRHRKKNGLLDVEKAEHFLEKMIELRMRNPDHFRPTARAFSQYQTRRFITAQEPALGEPESNVINLVSAWEGTPQLQQALQIVRSLKLEYYSEGAPTRGYNAQSLEPGEQS